mgnify:CR=1 FL=1
MTDHASLEPWTSFWRPWIAASLAPQQLWQSINSGWSFGNVIVNENNSSAPQTEQAILAEDSYGRQIGKLLDAVDALVKRQPDWDRTEAYSEVAELKGRVDRVKHAMALKRIDQLRRDLDMLRDSADAADRTQYEASMAALRGLLSPSPPGTPKPPR